MTKTTSADQIAQRLEHLAGFDGRLWANSPDVQRAHARAQRINPAVTAINAAFADSRTASQIVSAAFERLLDGQALDAEQLRHEVATVTAAREVAQIVATEATAASQAARYAAAAAERLHADEALAVMDRTVRELVDIGRTLIADSALTGSMEHAARAGQARELLTTAAAIHDKVRFTQLTTTKSDRFDGPSMIWLYGIVRDPSSLNPHASKLAGFDAHAQEGFRVPGPDLESLAIDGGEPFFRLVCRDDLEPWVPNEAQLLASREAMSKRIEKARWAATNAGIDKPREPQDSGARVTVGGQQVQATVIGSGLQIAAQA
jgi:hypothetical protein